MPAAKASDGKLISAAKTQPKREQNVTKIGHTLTIWILLAIITISMPQ